MGNFSSSEWDLKLVPWGLITAFARPHVSVCGCVHVCVPTVCACVGVCVWANVRAFVGVCLDPDPSPLRRLLPRPRVTRSDQKTLTRRPILWFPSLGTEGLWVERLGPRTCEAQLHTHRADAVGPVGTFIITEQGEACSRRRGLRFWLHKYSPGSRSTAEAWEFHQVS